MLKQQNRVGLVAPHFGHLLPSNIDRSLIVFALISAYRLDNLIVLDPVKASKQELLKFHSEGYIDFILQLNPSDFDPETLELICSNDEHKHRLEDLSIFNLEYDCKVFPEISNYCLYVAGSTIEAARKLSSKELDVVIHWDGGRHHATSQEAKGYCYVNDIVLGILELRETFKRVLYIDFDIHHGDGVQEAFELSSKVFTLSLHRFEEAGGFYPGTGSLSPVGRGKSKNHALNVPLKSGLTGALFLHIVKTLIPECISNFKPECIVLCAGADSLAGDPGGSSVSSSSTHAVNNDGFNIDIQSYCEAVIFIQELNLPLLVLGGGGYHHANTARLWTSITAALVNTPNKPYQKDDDSYMGISINIPEHIYFPLYKPDFTIFIPTGNRIDENMLVSKEDNGKTYIEKVLEVLLSLISETNYE